MESKLINNLGEKIDSFAADETQRKAVRISILFTGVLWVVLLLILGFAPTFQKKEKYKTVRIMLEPAIEKPIEQKQGVSEAAPPPVEKAEPEQKSESKPQPQKEQSAKAESKAQPKTQNNSSPQATKPTPKPAEKPVSTPSKAKIKYGKSVEDQMAETFDNTSKKDVNWDAVFDDDNSVTNSSSNANTSQKALSAQNALSGSAATASSANGPVTSKQETNQTTQTASNATKNALRSIKTVQYSDPFLAANGINATAKVNTVSNNDGRIAMELTDGSSRVLLDPAKPVIFISDEAAKLIDGSHTVKITFKILASGNVPLSSVVFEPASVLPQEIKSEIAGQISKWRFSTADYDGQARFEYSIIKG